MIYVLTHEYFDKSGFSVCGITDDHNTAMAWYKANDENNVYPIRLGDAPAHWMKGVESWRSRERPASNEQKVAVGD